MDVREKHGSLMIKDGKITALVLNEREECVCVVADDGLSTRSVYLTPNEARHIATKLRRIARRISERIGA